MYTEELVKGNVCYIVGNNGLGKTAALCYISQDLVDKNHKTKTPFTLFESEYNHQAKIGMAYVASQSIVTYQEEGEDWDEELSQLDFALVWRWHLLLAIIRDNKDEELFIRNCSWTMFERFVGAISKKELQVKVAGSVDLSLPENVPSLLKLIKRHISIEFPEFRIGRKEYTFQVAMAKAEAWFEKLEAIQRTTIPCYIFVNELDIHYGNEKAYLRDLRLVHDLVLEVKRMNAIFQKKGWNQSTKERKDVTWETCPLRRWLNQEFLQKTFTEEEQRTILTGRIENPDTSKAEAEEGKDTWDQVFLLS